MNGAGMSSTTAACGINLPKMKVRGKKGEELRVIIFFLNIKRVGELFRQVGIWHI
jgi:hypothetical protein